MTVTGQLTVDQSFDLKRVLDGTQDFRWCRRADGWYSGVLTGHLVHIRQAEGQLEYRANTDLAALLRSYFRLDENIEAIHAELAAVDARMAELVKSHSYLRVLRQPDPWQATVSYICSATNRIERITKSVENIACELGDCRELDSDIRRTFPTAQKVLEAGEARLEELTVGLKSFPKRIVRTASRVIDRSLDLEHLAKPDVCYAEARLQLMASPGIGAKVADCIALFALEKPEAFPADTYVRKALQCWYSDAPLGATEGEALAMWAREKFGKNAGYASQLLFLEQRTQEKGETVQLAKCAPCAPGEIERP